MSQSLIESTSTIPLMPHHVNDETMEQDSAAFSESIHTPPNANDTMLRLVDFVRDCHNSLLQAVKEQHPPVYSGIACPKREAVLQQFKRQPYPAQAKVIQAVTTLLVDNNERAAIINAEMGTGKTLMGIAAATLLHEAGYKRTLIISPPHLVHKWRREIIDTVPKAKVTVLQGQDTLSQLTKLAKTKAVVDIPEFYIIGRVRLRLGFHWRPAVASKRRDGRSRHQPLAMCAACGHVQVDDDGAPILLMNITDKKKLNCQRCHEALWQQTRPTDKTKGHSKLINTLCQLPTIGKTKATRLVNQFGEGFLTHCLSENPDQFCQLLDSNGQFVFSDNVALLIEKALGTVHMNGHDAFYQISEYIKRYLPKGFFANLIIDEGHEYKGSHSAQGQALGVVASQVKKVILLTGTLMGGYAEDVFHLLWRMNPKMMLRDGYRPNRHGSLARASTRFMERHGVLKEIHSIQRDDDYKTSKGKKVTIRTNKAPGFSPQGLGRYLLPITAFLKLSELDIALPPYHETLQQVYMDEAQAQTYQILSKRLRNEMETAMARGDRTLLGVVLNVLLAWPDCAFREEVVIHPHTKAVLADLPIYLGDEPSPKESAMIAHCVEAKRNGQKCLVYTTYTGVRDTANRLQRLIKEAGLKVAVLRSSVPTDKRELWITNQLANNIDVLVCNPELVKTGLDLLAFPNIVFMQSGYNTYTLMQACRRSWRIGQTEAVNVTYLGYEDTAQMLCLKLMAKKIAVSQSVSGIMPETGLDCLNQDGDSFEVALAKEIVK